MRKIWQEDVISDLSSFRNLKNNTEHIIPEIIRFVEINQPILQEWVLDQWVEDRNLESTVMGRVMDCHTNAT